MTGENHAFLQIFLEPIPRSKITKGDVATKSMNEHELAMFQAEENPKVAISSLVQGAKQLGSENSTMASKIQLHTSIQRMLSFCM